MALPRQPRGQPRNKKYHGRHIALASEIWLPPLSTPCGYDYWQGLRLLYTKPLMAESNNKEHTLISLSDSVD